MMTYVDMHILLHNYIDMGFILRLVPQVHIYIPIIWGNWGCTTLAKCC